jgi:D-3-phosphoglycerate dehydrogenase
MNSLSEIKKPKAVIYVADKIDDSGIEFLKKDGYKIINFFGCGNNELVDKISNIDSKSNSVSALIIRSVRKIQKKDLDKIVSKTNIRFISTASSGFDNIDFKYAQKLGIKIINVPDGNYISAAEHTMAMILGIFKHICYHTKFLTSDSFKNFEYTNNELFEKKIGIVGVGRVGSYLAKLCKSFNMDVYGNDIKPNLAIKYPWIRFRTLNELAGICDIISVHTPLDESTLNLIDAGVIKKMKKDAILINCARGGIINEPALIINLKKRNIRYAGIDVFANEPFTDEGFRSLNNVLLTPHQAGKTKESRVRISGMLAERLERELKKMSKKKKT